MPICTATVNCLEPSKCVPIAITLNGVGTFARCEIETSSDVVREGRSKTEVKAARLLSLRHGNKFQTSG